MVQGSEHGLMDGSLTRSFAQSVGLAFLNSVVPVRGVATDQLRDGRGLISWLNRVGLAPGADVERRWLERHADALDSAAESARRLRGWFQGFVRASLGRPLTSADLGRLRRLNSLVQEQRSFYQVVEAGGGALALRFSSSWSTPESALIRIAEALALFVCEVDFTRVRVCEGADCSHVFVDRSRARARRWCSMVRCGNRHKQAALRGRSRARAAPARPGRRAESTRR
jgi:predicted RNA-binding Zn ribbon-like protein